MFGTVNLANYQRLLSLQVVEENLLLLCSQTGVILTALQMFTLLTIVSTDKCVSHPSSKTFFSAAGEEHFRNPQLVKLRELTLGCLDLTDRFTTQPQSLSSGTVKRGGRKILRTSIPGHLLGNSAFQLWLESGTHEISEIPSPKQVSHNYNAS